MNLNPARMFGLAFATNLLRSANAQDAIIEATEAPLQP
jgi:hypothetical protein